MVGAFGTDGVVGAAAVVAVAVVAGVDGTFMIGAFRATESMGELYLLVNEQ